MLDYNCANCRKNKKSLQKILTEQETDGIVLLVVRVTDQICGSVGTGRRARLRIL